MNNVAIYCRLSTEDRGAVEESSSIQTQKESLTKYALDNGWNIFKVYIDDGYSGTVFESRPAFNEMIDDIKKGYINILLTKDLSRLGRNYIKTGYYTEQFFPEHNIRYIAVNDNYDSDNNQDEFIPFKNIMNEFYAKDISKKIRYAYNTRVERGELIPTAVPYGYYKEGKLIKVDEEAALIVKLIFEEYIKYGKPLMVANILNEKGILPPSAHYYNRKGVVNANPPKNKGWTSNTIGKIIRQEAYKGVHVAKKTYNISFKDKKRRANPKDKWVYIEGIYEPIIDEEVWDKANKLMDSQIHNPYTLDINKYSSVLFCGHCGKPMHLVKRVRKHDSVFEYLCKNYVNNCSGHTIRVSELDERVKYGLLRMKKIILSNEEEFRRQAIEFTKKNEPNNANTDEVIIESLMTRDRVLDNLIEKVIEKNLSGLLASSTSDSLLKKYKAEKDDIAAKLKELKKQTEEKKNDISYEKQADMLIELLKVVDEDIEIDNLLITSIISRIEVKSQPRDGKWNVKFTDIEFLGLPNKEVEAFLNEHEC